MAAVGGTLVKHYKELAYMGFIPVLSSFTYHLCQYETLQARHCGVAS